MVEQRVAQRAVDSVDYLVVLKVDEMVASLDYATAASMAAWWADGMVAL